MAQIIRIWNSLSVSQRVSLVIAPLLVAAIAAGVIRWRHDAAFRTLYSSLAPEDAAVCCVGLVGDADVGTCEVSPPPEDDDPPSMALVKLEMMLEMLTPLYRAIAATASQIRPRIGLIAATNGAKPCPFPAGRLDRSQTRTQGGEPRERTDE